LEAWTRSAASRSVTPRGPVASTGSRRRARQASARDSARNLWSDRRVSLRGLARVWCEWHRGPGRIASATTALRGGSNSVTVNVSRVSNPRIDIRPWRTDPRPSGRGRGLTERQRSGTRPRRGEEVRQERPDLVGRTIDNHALVDPHGRLPGGVRGARLEKRLLPAIGLRLVTPQERAEQRPYQDPASRRFQVERGDLAGALRRCP
jgi:hypothetical protein